MNDRPVKLAVVIGLGLCALTGCDEVIDLDPVNVEPPIEARVRPVPISGGTLMVTHDGIAVAADPDRDLVQFASVDELRLLHTIELEPGDEPGRVIQGSAGLVHVVLRGFGGITTIDRTTGEVASRRALCSDPRGIAFDAHGAAREPTLHVACADGTLLEIAESSDEEISRTILTPDLRDVTLVDGVPHVTQFRAAALLAPNGDRTPIGDLPLFEPHVAWKTWLNADGSVSMLHQVSSTQEVAINPDPEDLAELGDLPYGGGGNFCEPGINAVALSTLSEDVDTTILPMAALTVDAAPSPDDEWIALAMPGAPAGEATLGYVHRNGFGCDMLETPTGDAQVTSVAYTADGKLVAQSRQPNILIVQEAPPHSMVRKIDLGGGSRFDTGHEIFHRATDSGLSCASCHPEGTDDGHIWRFTELGARRTQPLDVGLEGTAPFHWDGDMGDLDVLMDEVLAHRMGGMKQSPERQAAFSSWVFDQQLPPADTGRDDPTLVAEGQALFTSLDCGSCHSGAILGGTMAAPVRGKTLQVPSLRRVSLRPPFMHDGRSATLDDAVIDMIVTTTPNESPDPNTVAALSAYMRTL